MCKVSVITASYNYANYISEAIESVIAQDFSDWEMIIVDDGSQDDSREVIQKYVDQDSRIKLYAHENFQNKGLRETLKTAIAYASGKYIAFLESDDRWDPKNLAIKVNALEQHPQAALVDDAVELFGNTDLFARYEQYWQLRNKLLSKKSFPANIYKELFTENIIPTFSCVICRTNVLKGCSFDYIYPAHLDRSLWLQICKNNLFYHIDLPLTFWRIHDSSYISLESKKYRKNLIFKIYMLLKPCYQGGFLNPLLHTAVIRFVAVNLLRSIKNRFTKPKN